MKSRAYLAVFTMTAVLLAACSSEPPVTVEESVPTVEGSNSADRSAVSAAPAAPVSAVESRNVSSGMNSGAASEGAQFAAGTTRQPEARPAQPAIISSGTRMEVMLIDPISTETNLSGDTFLAALVEPIVVDGSVVIAEGVRVRGRIVDLQEPGRVRGRARIEMVLTEIVGTSVTIPISTASFVQEAEADLGRDATLGAVGAAAGAVVGGLTGGRTGAIIGGTAGGAGTVAVTRGDQLEYPPESRLNFTLSDSFEVPAGQTIS